MDKEEPSLGNMGEGHGRCEELGTQHRRTSRSKGSGMLRKQLTELGRPSSAHFLRKCKAEAYKPKEVKWRMAERESEGVIRY
jgi:hypothetical protein